MDLSTAITYLKKIVKPSESSDGKNHIHLGLVATDDRETYKKALEVVQNAISGGEITREKFNHAVGIE